MTSENQKAPIWFWALALIIAMLHIMLLMAYLQDPIPKTVPTLIIAGNTIGVFSGIIASLRSNLKKKISSTIFHYILRLDYW